MKSPDNFHKCRTKPDGLYKVCKECRKISSKTFRENHLEELRAKDREHNITHAEQHRERARAYQQEHWEERKAWARAWNKANPVAGREKCAFRTAYKLGATPPWLTKAQKKEIRWFYETAAELQWLSEEPLQVDHIYPLIGKDTEGNHIACGLHVSWNLQILSASQNASKGSKMP